MKDLFFQGFGNVFDGLFFGLGILAVYIGAVLTGALIRALGNTGGQGLSVVGRYVVGWLDYMRGDDKNTVNVTLNMVVWGQLKFDTLVADRRLWNVWTNPYRQYLIRRAAKQTTDEDPVLHFNGHKQPTGISAFIIRRLLRASDDREDEYRATYAPLLSLIAENCTNDGSLDLSIGKPMEELRFVVALTFEKLHPKRARRLRAMVIWEPMLQSLSEDNLPQFERPEHANRYQTLLSIARHYKANPSRFGILKVWRPATQITPAPYFPIDSSHLPPWPTYPNII